MTISKTSRLQNSKNSLYAFLIALAAIALVTSIIYFGFKQSAGNSFRIALLVGLVFANVWLLFSWFNYRRRAGALLLDLAPYPAAILFRILGAIDTLAGLVYIYMNLTASPADRSWSFVMLDAVLIGPFWLYLGFSRLQVRQGGIAIYGDLVKWGRIESYEWISEAGARPTVRLQLTGRYPAFLRQGAIPLAPEKQEQMKAILAQYLPGLTPAEPPQPALPPA